MTLQLNLQARAQPFIAGGPMPLGLNLRNTGDTAVEAPAYEGPTQFEYLLLTENGATTIESLSYRKKELSRSGGLRPRLVPNVQPLAPGGVLLYRDDLADLTLHPFAPGKYQLEAIYRLPGNVLVRSNRVPIQVIASRPVATVQGLDSPRANLNAYEFHREDDARFTLRKWESSTDHPLQGRFQNLHTQAIEAPVSSFAMAMEVEAADLGRWRWVAWTSGGQVWAEVTRAIDVKYPSGGLATGLSAPALLEYGYQFADGHGLFLVAGLGSAGRKIRLLTLPADEELPPQFTDVPLPVVPDAPAMATFYAARAISDGAGGEGRYEIALSWLLRTPNATGFVMARLDPGTAALNSPPRTVFSTNRSVLAHAVPPVVMEDIPQSLAFLLAPAESGGAYTLQTVNVHDTAQVEAWNLPPFGDSAMEAAPPERWILPSDHAANAPVVAVSDRRLWLVRPGSGWHDTKLELTTAASPVRLWSLPNGEFWCTWFDTVHGYRLHRVA